MNEAVIEVKDVTIELGGVEIFTKANFDVYKGETLVIIGPSGSGKSVLLKSMAGLHEPKEGHVLIEGEDWQDLESEEKHELARKVGMLFQKDALFDSLTSIENVEFPLTEHYDLSQKELDDRAMSLLKAVGLEGDRDKYPHELSGGMKRRLGIARALALNPKIVFYDDPISGQDPVRGDQMAHLVEDIKKQFSSTVIMVLNDMGLAFETADRILMVVQKEVIVTGTPEETKNCPDERVQQFINGRLEGPIQLS